MSTKIYVVPIWLIAAAVNMWVKLYGPATLERALVRGALVTMLREDEQRGSPCE